MKTVFWFFITCIIATIGFFAALSMKTPWIGFVVAFGVWLIFLWNTTKPRKH
ncbi:hypothetical protein SAMN05421747_112129 [Parapedobacter composti]|uniref:Uncharacterized protein n=1 Tax=Parapedobacter composti TaxID=623281 RepID=A0A1I1JTA6_9SPHI|nr:hypothetical protein SAMN05421747_112129 [Parapedobacter composti]